MDEVANKDETEDSHEFEKGAVLATVVAVEEIAERQIHPVVENEGIYDLDYQYYD